MVKVINDSIVIKVNKLVKDNHETTNVLSNDQRAAIIEVIEASMTEVVEDDSIVIEVEFAEI
jgi:hypothetical protein